VVLVIPGQGLTFTNRLRNSVAVGSLAIGLLSQRESGSQVTGSVDSRIHGKDVTGAGTKAAVFQQTV